MGINVKLLLNHLRERQKEHGVNAFRFHHILRNNKLEVAEYPEESTAVMATDGPQVGMEDDKPVLMDPPASVSTPSKKKTNIKSSTKGRKAKVLKTEDTNAPSANTSAGNQNPTLVSGTSISSSPTTTVPAEDVGSQTPKPLEIARPNGMPTGVPMESSIPMPMPPTTWPHPSAMVFPDNPHNPHFPPCPPHLMSYYPQFLAYMSQQGEANFHGAGSHFLRGSNVAGQFSNIDPHLLPPGPPPFFSDQESHRRLFLENYYGTEVASQQIQSGRNVPGIPSAGSSNHSTPSKTPKRKRSQSKLDDDYTPSRSTRKRKPSQKMLASREMVYDP